MFRVSKFNRNFPKFCVVNDVFSSEEVDKIIELEDLIQFTKGAVGNGTGEGTLNEKARACDIQWIAPDNNSHWLFQKFSDLVSHVNYDNFMCDIEFFENFQYTVYKENEFYDWHVDAFSHYYSHTRKISATVILTDPNDHEGGEFEIIPHGEVHSPVVLKPKKGDVIFFSSLMPHRVRPVTKGIRKSLVTWVLGKNNEA